MKKKLLIVLFLIKSLSLQFASADSPTLDSCEELASLYGSSEEYNFIDPSCFDLFEKNAAPNAIKLNSDETFKLIGYKNIIFIKDTRPTLPSIKIYAGKNILVSNITSVTWDENHNEFFVLDNLSGRIFAFSSIIDGNVSPLREFQSDLLINSNDFLIHSEKNQIMINNSSTGKILFFKRNANIHARKNKKHINLIKEINGVSDKVRKIKLDSNETEIFLIDENNNQIFSYKLKD